MFDWLFEGRLAVYLTLALVGVILLGLWWRDRRRSWLYALAGVALLAGLYFLLDVLVETRREQITRRLGEISRSVKAGDAEGVMKQISPQFDYRGLKYAAFGDLVRSNILRKYVDDLTLWGYNFADHSGKVTFKAKPKGKTLPDNAGFAVVAEFVQDPDKQWRMKTFEVYDPLVNSQSPIDVTPWIR